MCSVESTKTCSCIRVWPRLPRSTEPRTLSTTAMRILSGDDAVRPECLKAPGLVSTTPPGTEPARWFVLNTEANVEVDFTALEAVDAVRAELAGRGTVFALARVKQDLLDDLAAFGLVEKVGGERIFPTLPTAVAAYRQWAEGHPPPGPDHPA